MTTEGDEVEVEGLGVLRNRIVEDCTGARPSRREEVASPISAATRNSPASASRTSVRHALTAMPAPRMLLILSENWTLTDGRDLTELVRWARIAEDAGFDSVMISEHVVLGPDASDKGVMANPRALCAAGQPGPVDAVAQLADAAVRDRGGDQPHPVGGVRRCWRRCAIRCCWPVNWARWT